MHNKTPENSYNSYYYYNIMEKYISAHTHKEIFLHPFFLV